MCARPGPTSRPTSSDLSPPLPQLPTPAPARLQSVKSAHQRPRSNYSPAWPAHPRRRLLCSRHLPNLLHASTILSPRPRSSQANTPPPLRPGHPPRRHLLYSWCIPELLHTLADWSPRPQSGQADVLPPLCPSRPPRLSLCHLDLQHASAPPRCRLTTGHHR
jgi:hypothetical protein